MHARDAAHRAAPEAERLLIVRLSALGDVITALPAVAALREARPEAHIAWAVEPVGARIVRGFQAADEVFELPRKALKAFARRGPFAPEATAQLRAFRRTLRAYSADIAVDLQGNLKSGLITRLSGAPRRLGPSAADAREAMGWFLTERAGAGGRPMHRIDAITRILQPLGVHAAKWPLPWPNSQPAPPPAGKVLLWPGTSTFMPHKRWPASRWAELAAGLGQAGWACHFGLGLGEQDLHAEIRVHLERSAPAALARVSWDEDPPSLEALAESMHSRTLVIGGDTGPIRLAEVLGVPVFTLLGPTDPRLYYPYRHPERAHFRRVACAPCRHRACSTRDCMSALSVEEVLSAASRLLSEDAAGPVG